MSWMASRDVIVALGLTAIFTVLSEGLFNDESKFCIVPEKYKILNKIMDENNDGQIDENELKKATELIERAKKREKQNEQRMAALNFDTLKI